MKPMYRLTKLLGIAAGAALIVSACAPPATAPPATPVPTVAATLAPTVIPTVAPTAVPTVPPADTATAAPTAVPATAAPTEDPGVEATSVKLDNPFGIAFGPDGKLYVSECSSGSDVRLVSIDLAGMLKLYAGSGFGFGGDDEPISAGAQFWCMTALAFDSAGNLYIADQGNNRIRRIDPAGLITTVAGSGAATKFTDTYPAKGGFAGDGGPATAAELSEPTAVAFDADGNLYILDRGNNRVRVMDTNGIITTFAGNGTWGFSGDGGPAMDAELSTSNGLAVDAAGNVYIADSDNARIRRVDANGIITTIAGTGKLGYSGDGKAATAAMLSRPAALAFDAAGNLYFADKASTAVDTSRIRKIDTDGNISTITSVTRSDSSIFSSEGGLAFDSDGNLYVADPGLDLVRKVDQDGNITAVAGGGS